MSENKKIMAILLLFWFSFIAWFGFAVTLLHGLYPEPGITEPFNFLKVTGEVLFYFGPHLFISLILYYKYGRF